MRRSLNGPRSASTAASLAIRQSGTIGRRAVSTDENHMKQEKGAMGENQSGNTAGSGPGPVTARLKMLEKRYSQVLEMQAKFAIMDKWLQQQFGIKLFPPPVVNNEKFEEGNPDDVDNPFYAVYLVIQRMKFLEERVKKLEARPYEETYEPKPTSNYSSAHAFRNFKGKPGPASSGVKRTYGASSAPTTPKKAKVVARSTTPQTYSYKPSVKILPRDPNATTPVKKPTENRDSPSKIVSPIKLNEEVKVVVKVEMDAPPDAETQKEAQATQKQTNVKDENQQDNTEILVQVETSSAGDAEDTKTALDEKMEVVENKEGKQSNNSIETNKTDDAENNGTPEKDESTGTASSEKEIPKLPEETEKTESQTNEKQDDVVAKEPTQDDSDHLEEVAGAPMDIGMDMDSEQELDDEEVEQKPEIPFEDDDISGSEASASSLTFTPGPGPGRPRLSTRRQAAASSSTTDKTTDEEKPVMYTARGRRHTVPRRYAEFTGHDNVVSILKSQQKAEKSTERTGPGRPGRKPGSSKLKGSPPKMKKMVKTPKTPKKVQPQFDSDGDLDLTDGGTPPKKKAGTSTVPIEKPPCVDALVDRVMAREVDSDGMVVLSEAYPNIYVNQQQLVTVIVRSNGKATRLTRKMTTLVFEDSQLASASPFGTKYYKDRLPPEPLEAMVDFIADSGFEPHYTKKKIYMIVGQVCNEARAGRVSRKFMHPLENTPLPGPSGGSVPTDEELPSTPTDEEPPMPMEDVQQ